MESSGWKKTCNKLLEIINGEPATKCQKSKHVYLDNLQNKNKQKKQDHISSYHWFKIGPPCPGSGSYLFSRLGGMEQCSTYKIIGLMEQIEWRGVNVLRMMVSQGTHAGRVIVGRNGGVLIVTSTPLFIHCLNFLGFLAPGQGFNPFLPISYLLLGFLGPFRFFSPFLRALAPRVSYFRSFVGF